MIIVSYDISEDKLRTRFSKYLERYGNRLQYSVYEINNTDRILEIIKQDIEDKFSKFFSGSDSVLVFTVNNNNVIKYGNAIHRDKDLIII